MDLFLSKSGSILGCLKLSWAGFGAILGYLRQSWAIFGPFLGPFEKHGRRFARKDQSWGQGLATQNPSWEPEPAATNQSIERACLGGVPGATGEGVQGASGGHLGRCVERPLSTQRFFRPSWDHFGGDLLSGVSWERLGGVLGATEGRPWSIWEQLGASGTTTATATATATLPSKAL